jgi:YHS domain-containing protein
LSGCSSTSPDATGSSTPAAADDHGDHDHDEHAQHGDDEGQSDMEKMTAELAKLSAEDSASAEQQHICPVSGEMLGTMGAPQKVDVNGQQVWICCEGCKDQLLENPDEYLAKLQKE